MKMELIEGSETSAIRTQTPGNYPKENMLHIEHGESLKSRIFLISFCQGGRLMHRKLLGIVSVDFDTKSTTVHIFCIHQIIERKYENKEAIHQLFMYFKKTHYSFRREVLCIIYIDFSISVKIVKLIQHLSKWNL